MGTNTFYFNDTCEIFDLRTCSGEMLNERFLAPCSCFYYYQCTKSFEMVQLDCAAGTAWDYRAKKCNRVVDVFSAQECDENNNVWNRCNVSETRLQQLQQQCSAPSTTHSLSLSTMSSGYACISPNSDLVHAAVLIVFIICLFTRRMKFNIPVSRSSAEFNHNSLDDDGYSEEKTPANQTVRAVMGDSARNSYITAKIYIKELVEIGVEEDNTRPLKHCVGDPMFSKFRHKRSTSNMTGAIGSNVTSYKPKFLRDNLQI